MLAAIDHLAGLPYVDPDRIYVGGHSTGGTLALLVAASEAPVAGVVAFGPVPYIMDYGGDFMYADGMDVAEVRLRSPRYWFHTIDAPTWVLEGEDGNHQALLSIDAWNTNGQLRTVVLRGHDHFSPLAGVNERLAAQIVNGAAWDEVAPAELQEGADAPFVAVPD